MEERVDFFKRVIRPNFKKKTGELAAIMTKEMEKPISQNVYEVKKSIKPLDCLIEDANTIYSEEEIKRRIREVM
ncbi:MAG: hypothetical protein QXP36_03145 [Conexivisphaerales archaeon]